MPHLIECVPNFSEGRDAAKVEAIVEAIRSAGATILHRTMDADHNRSVVTFVADPGAAGEAAFRGVREAVALIDLRQHSGVHPRIGAADVVPFVPLRGVTLEDCAAIARTTGHRIWQELGVPVYLYEAAAVRSEHANLANVRRRLFDPDIGGPALHPSAGATAVGARKFLIAFNVVLDTPDIQIAKRIARAVRASSGGLPFVKALGVHLASRNLAQVSMNLTDFEQTSIRAAFDAVSAEAGRWGVGIASTEVIGLAPARALETAGIPGLEWKICALENYIDL